MDVSVKDNDNVIHAINVDTLPDNSDTQIVKLQLGTSGVDGGLISNNNPAQAEIAGIFKRLFGIFGRFSFSTNSSLRVDCGGTSVAISGTPTTNVTTLTTGNIGFGDSGKASTIQQVSQQSFMVGIRQNFSKV